MQFAGKRMNENERQNARVPILVASSVGAPKRRASTDERGYVATFHLDLSNSSCRLPSVGREVGPALIFWRASSSRSRRRVARVAARRTASTMPAHGRAARHRCTIAAGAHPATLPLACTLLLSLSLVPWATPIHLSSRRHPHRRAAS